MLFMQEPILNEIFSEYYLNVMPYIWHLLGTIQLNETVTLIPMEEKKLIKNLWCFFLLDKKIIFPKYW